MLITRCTASPTLDDTGLTAWHRPVLWLVLACLFGLDIITTTVGLQLGYGESNPLMAAVVANPLLHGIVKIGAYLLLFGVIEQAVEFIHRQRPAEKPFPIRINYICLYGVILVAMVSLIWLYTAVLVHNIGVIAAAGVG